MKASKLPWWAWLLIAAALGVAALIGWVRMADPSTIVVVLTMLATALGALCAIVGFIRFFKWAWKD